MTTSFPPPEQITSQINPQPPKTMAEMKPSDALLAGLVPANLADTIAYSMITDPSFTQPRDRQYSATTPLLVSPNLQLRMSTSTSTEDTSTLQAAYEMLYNALPNDLKEDLEVSKQMAHSLYPTEDVQWLLMMVALGVISAQSAVEAASMDAASVEGQNISFFTEASTAALSQASTVAGTTNQLLMQEGAGYPNFDQAMSLSTQMSDHAISLSSLLPSAGAPLTAAQQQQLTALTGNLSSLAAQAATAPLGNEWQLLAPTIDAMALIASAAANVDVAPLLLSANIASIGISQADSALGLVGAAYGTIANQLTAGLLSVLPEIDAGNAALFSNVTAMALAVGMMTAAEISNTRGNNAQLDFEMALIMGVESGFVDEIAMGIAGITGADAQAAGIAAAIALTSTLLMMQVISGGTEGVLLKLIDGAAPQLATWLLAVDQIVNQALEEQDKSNQEMKLLIHQAVLALDIKNSEIFLQIVESALQKIDISTSQLKTQGQELAQLTAQLTADWAGRSQTSGPLSTGLFAG